MLLCSALTMQEIFNIVVENLPELDAINVTAALQRLAKARGCCIPLAGGRRLGFRGIAPSTFIPAWQLHT